MNISVFLVCKNMDVVEFDQINFLTVFQVMALHWTKMNHLLEWAIHVVIFLVYRSSLRTSDSRLYFRFLFGHVQYPPLYSSGLLNYF